MGYKSDQAIDIQDIFKTQLKIEAKVMAIETLFANERRTRKTDFKPSYQRNYVWDDDKATYFIESILLGTEIPPIIFFNSENKIEVIDGRQRYETIKRFIDKEFKLRKKGLLKLKDLRNKNFDDLQDLKDIFWDTKLRVIEFSFRDPSLASLEKEDLVKKEIFKRYNSGITPLRAVEIDKAKYQDNQINAYFKNRITKSDPVTKLISEILYFDLPLDIEKALRKIRQQLVLPSIPIKYYANTSSRQEVTNRFFDYLSGANDDIDIIYRDFVDKLDILKKLKLFFESAGLHTNKLIFECLYWGLSIVEIENKSIDILLEQNNKEQLLHYLNQNLDSYSIEDNNFYKQVIERYDVTSKIFERIFDISFDVYLSTNQTFIEQNKELGQVITDNVTLSRFESLRLNKPDASSNTIDDICSRMSKERFLLRPPYQRKEVIDRFKSSAIIESILLGIKLPPIFLFKRNDGVAEVLDGQQRLLSILGYLGREFMDVSRKFVPSEKNNFSLRKLNILKKDFEGKKFSELPTKYQDKILDFDLWIIEISEKTNPDFDPIDLFIRLNYKPFPILDNTFEMWNSYIDRDIINLVKEIHIKYKNWFYVRVDNRRMENESLITYLSFLEYKAEKGKTERIAPTNLDIYKSSSKVNIRIVNKSEITQILDDPKNKALFIESCKSLETNFILKLKTLLSANGKSDDESLKVELDSLLGLSIRRFQNFYSLWYILLNIPQEAISNDKISLREAINKLLQDMKSQKAANSFTKEVETLQAKYI